MADLRINDPCPVLLMRMKKNPGGYYCNSCNHPVIDFTGKSASEIKNELRPGMCGIFYADQLPGQQRQQFGRQIVFYALSLLSFLGFNVSPVKGQTNSKPDTVISVSTPPYDKPQLIEDVADDAVGTKKKQEKNRDRNKKAIKRRRLAGCPVF